MEMKFTKEQYADLVKLVYLGNWMVNAVRPDEDQVEKFNDLEQYIYTYAREAGFDDYIQFDKKANRYITNWEKDKKPEVDKYIDDYDDENFWHEIIHRMAERDLVRKYGQAAVDAMSLEERVEKEEPFVNKYENEFGDNGLDNFETKAKK